MNNQIETWIAPEFEDISVSMECTAYSETLD
jgi:coenzyme PQQ precursor peptide PqqA